jgi:hypothetical protein
MARRSLQMTSAQRRGGINADQVAADPLRHAAIQQARHDRSALMI